MFIIEDWGSVIFRGAAEFVLVLRLWAIYNRSRPILVALLILFLINTVDIVVLGILVSIPKDLSVTTAQILDSSVNFALSFTWLKVSAFIQMAHSAVICLFVIVQFVRQSLQMYHATKQWGLSQYMNLLAQQGVFYFFATFLSYLVQSLVYFGIDSGTGWRSVASVVLEFLPKTVIMPRFILSVRELYARDVQGRCGDGIDTGFGLSSGRGGFGTGFGGGLADLRDEDAEDIQLEIGTSQPE